jgi:hypothetical protein
LESRAVPAAILASGAGEGGGPHVRVFDASGAAVAEFLAYGPAFTGGVRVATGDVTGDGVDDLVTAPGPGGGPHVKVFDGAALLNGLTRELYSFSAYGPAFRGGVNIAVADVTGDGFADIVTGAGQGGGPHVKVFDGATGQMARSIMAFDPDFRGGVNVAAGYVLGYSGLADIVTAPGPGGGPHVKVFVGSNGNLARQWLAYDATFRGGVSVATGQFTADAHADIVTAPGFGGGPHVKVFDGVGVLSGPFASVPVNTVREFAAYDPAFRGGVRVAAADLTGDGWEEVITGAGPGGASHMRAFDGQTGQARIDRLAFDPAFRGGVSVGGLALVDPAGAVTRSFDFRQGEQGWVAEFDGFPVGMDPAEYQLEAGLRPVPTELGDRTGFMVQGRSIDPFMFLKRRLGPADGIRPGQAYRALFTIEFGSNAPSTGNFAFGHPGLDVGLFAGGGADEPRVVPVTGYLRMSVERSPDGRYASLLGNVANGQPVNFENQPYVAVTRRGAHDFAARADAAGNLWLLVGTASGFEGFTRLYYLRITVTLLPLEGLS